MGRVHAHKYLQGLLCAFVHISANMSVTESELHFYYFLVRFPGTIEQLSGADPGAVDWVASHPPWVCSWGVHTTNPLFEHSLIYLNKSFLQTKSYDETQINLSDRVNRE